MELLNREKAMYKVMHKKKRFLIAVNVIGLIITGFLLFRVQLGSVERKWDERLSQKESEIALRVQNADKAAESAEESYDEVYSSKAKTAAYMAHNVSSFSFDGPYLQKLREHLGVNNIIIIDKNGHVLAEAMNAMTESFEVSRFNTLRTVFDHDETSFSSEPFTVNYNGTERRYYAAAIDDMSAIVIEQNPAELTKTISLIDSYEKNLKKVIVGIDGFVFAVSSKDYTFKYYPENESLEGMDAIDAGIDADSLQNGRTSWMNINGRFYYCGVYFNTDNSDYLIAAVPGREIFRSIFWSGLIMLIVMAAVLAAVTVYTFNVIEESAKRLIDLRQDNNDSTDYSRNKLWVAMLRRTGVVSVIGLIIFAAVCVYIQALFTVSNDSISNLHTADAVEGVIDDGKELYKDLTDQYDQHYLNKCQTAARILSDEPELENKSSLAKLASALDATAVYIFDSDGKMTASSTSLKSFSLSNDPSSQSYEFRKLLNGSDYIIQEPKPDDAAGRIYQYIGVVLKDSDNISDGFVQIAMDPDMLKKAQEASEISNILDDSSMGINGMLMAVNKQTGELVYYPDSHFIGKPAADHGIGEDVLKDGFSGYIKVDGNDYFGKCIEVDNYYVIIALKSGNDIYSGFDMSTAYMLLMGAVLHLVVFMTACLERFDLEIASLSDQTASAEHKGNDTGRGTVGKADKNEAGGRFIRDSWKRLSPEGKLYFLIRVYLSAFAVIVMAVVLYGQKMLSPDSLIMYIIDKKWERNLNIFSITATLMFVSVVSICLMIVRALLNVLSETLGSRGSTICQLLRSFIKYITWILAIYYCLNLYGVDTKTLVASAGLLSIVIGLGAQGLVSDILAGLFIIFEGEFRVGDIVTIGDWSGTVREIGFRTTKVESIGNDIKIFSNSAVTGVINMTRQKSCATVNVAVKNTEPIERVESILAEEFPRIRQLIPEISEGPFYLGVKEFNDLGTVLYIYALCDETNRISVEYGMNRAIKLIFDEHGITIPAISYRMAAEPEHVNSDVSWVDKYKSEQFIKEQKDQTENIMAGPGN